MVHVHTCIDFKVCSESLEVRRRRIARRKEFSTQMKHIFAVRAKRKRNRHSSKVPINLIAKKMQKEVRRLDRKDGELYDAYLARYMMEIKRSLKVLKDANHKVTLLQARIGTTLKFSRWVACVRMFVNRVRICLDWYEKWIHPKEVHRQLRSYITLMTGYQTTTAAHWIQIQVKAMLEQVLDRMFWTY
ncbi:MAG: hypothetical protein GY737_10555 [Desulfobacteraceae bacterium]|nr:hypothetical protein [Desulfobacteraceae bacterium]